jgi:hypothetical protein
MWGSELKMVNDKNSKPKHKYTIPEILVGLVLFTALFAGLIGAVTGSSESTKTDTASGGKNDPYRMEVAPQPEIDIMTKSSCKDWIAIIGEGAKGINSESEIRAGMQKVYETARYSTDADIVDAATRQLAALTAGDIDAFSVASTDFGNACKAHGAL